MSPRATPKPAPLDQAASPKLGHSSNQNDTRQIAGDIVSSYLSNNQMPPEQVPDFIRSVIAALQNEEHAPAAEEPQKPAVSIKRSVSQDAVVCLECGAKQKTLKRHIRVAHGLEESDYRGKWGLSKDHPLVAPDYSKARSAMAQKIGLGQKGRSKKART